MGTEFKIHDLLTKQPVYPLGIKTSQTWQQVIAHLEIIRQYEVRQFIELGVLHGGLANLISTLFGHTGCAYIGFERDFEQIDAGVLRTIPIVQGDIFEDRIVAFIEDEIKLTKGPVYLFCDNGNKPREIKTFAPLLRSGDIISIHDYGTEVFDRDLEILKPDFTEIEGTKEIGMPIFIRS